MAQNFLVCDREQELLLPPSVREWSPEGHPAWFVIGAVAQLDLSAFYAGYRADGHGPGGARSGGDCRAAALLLRDRGAVVAAGRSPLRRGRRDPRDVRQSGAGSHDDRGDPTLQLLPGSLVHADLAAVPALAAAHEQCAARWSRSCSLSASASWIRSPARQSTTIMGSDSGVRAPRRVLRSAGSTSGRGGLSSTRPARREHPTTGSEPA
jgi:hypothetical protein